MAKPSPNADELAIAIGHALSAWTGVELAMEDLFTIISGLPQKRARMLMASAISFDARLAMCNTMMNDEEPMSDLLPLWRKVATRLSKDYKSRHQVAHFTFLTRSDGGDGAAVTVAPYFSIGNAFLGRAPEIGLTEIKEKQGRFEELRASVLWFWMNAMNRKHGSIGLPQTPDLILRLQSSASQTHEGNQPPLQS